MSCERTFDLDRCVVTEQSRGIEHDPSRIKLHHHGRDSVERFVLNVPGLAVPQDFDLHATALVERVLSVVDANAHGFRLLFISVSKIHAQAGQSLMRCACTGSFPCPTSIVFVGSALQPLQPPCCLPVGYQRTLIE
jgi:hypothetical protein